MSQPSTPHQPTDHAPRTARLECWQRPAPAVPLVVIPTRDEARSLPLLADELEGFDVLVVDDTSPDGTADVARELGFEVVRLPRGSGYAAALQAGFREADHAGVARVVQLDADGSHAPAAIPALLAHDAALVIGSRYVPGGDTVRWSRRRRLLSRAAGSFSRLAGGPDVRDPTGGFRVWRTEVLRPWLQAAPAARGFAWNAWLVRALHGRGERIVEVPIDFGPRRAGHSKMTVRMALEGAWALARPQ